MLEIAAHLKIRHVPIFTALTGLLLAAAASAEEVEPDAPQAGMVTNFAPKLGLAWEASGRDTLHLTLARGFRAPQATELYRLQSGQNVADLDSEVLDSLELGWRRAAASFDLALTAFYSEKDNVIFRDAEGFNVSDGRTRHAGVEAEAGVALGGDLTLFLAGTYARHR